VTDTTPLPLPESAADSGAPDERKVAGWLEPLVGAGVEPRSGVLLAGDRLAEAVVAAARLVGPRGRVVALVRDAAEASALRSLVSTIRADCVEVWDGATPIGVGGPELRLALALSGPIPGGGGRREIIERLRRSIDPRGRVVRVAWVDGAGPVSP
jgi:hypothetical protein